MTNHTNRGRVTLYALDSNYRRYHYKCLADTLPRGWTAEALCDRGLLARSRVGTLAIWQGDRLVSVDRAKAQAALDAMLASTDDADDRR